MKPSSSIRLSLVVFGGVFAALLMVGFLRGQTVARDVAVAALWAGIVSGIFIASRLYRSFRGLDSGL